MRFTLVFLLFGVAAIACHDDPPVTYPTTASFDQSSLPLGTGDKIAITVFYGSKQLAAQYTLDTSGAISVPYIGTVTAGGKTLGKLKDEVQQRLADGYLQEPIVSVNLMELNSATLSVSGMVGKTGNIRYTPGLMITDVIALSGGFTPLARKNMVKVTRATAGAQQQTYKVPVERISEGERPNFPMMPGDEVFVPERPW
jgi:polysaccharide biosynthesis/export protein